jgi:signal transduction histidine kinase
MDDVDLVVRLPEAADAIGHPHLKSAFREVLENAVEHNDAERTAIELSVTTTPRGTVELTVADNGPGIPEIERRAIESMEDLPLNHSGGLGLWFAKLGCAVTGGDLVIRAPEAGGSEVVLQFPAARGRSIRERITPFWSGTVAA